MSDEQLNVDVEELAARSNPLRQTSPGVILQNQPVPEIDGQVGPTTAQQPAAAVGAARAIQYSQVPSATGEEAQPALAVGPLVVAGIKSRSVAFAPQVPSESKAAAMPAAQAGAAVSALPTALLPGTPSATVAPGSGLAAHAPLQYPGAIMKDVVTAWLYFEDFLPLSNVSVLLICFTRRSRTDGSRSTWNGCSGEIVGSSGEWGQRCR